MGLLEKIKPLPDHIESLTAEFKSRGGAPKIPIQLLPNLNEKIWGFKNGEMVIVGARTSQGKSAFASQLAWDFADQNIPVLFLSLEMTVNEMIERMFCNVMEVDNFQILSGGFNRNPAIREKFEVFKEVVKKLKMIVTCGVGNTFPEVLKTIELLDPTPKVVIVDYIQSIKTTAGAMREGLDEYIRQFRQLALERKFCGILCSQVNRGAMHNAGNTPTLSQLKSTGTLEEHADKVFLLHWEHHYDSNKPQTEYVINIAKNRNGRTGTYYLDYTPQYYKFTECDNVEYARRLACHTSHARKEN